LPGCKDLVDLRGHFDSEGDRDSAKHVGNCLPALFYNLHSDLN
jgi:hypothetical protein